MWTIPLPGIGTQPTHGGAHALPRGSRGAAAGARTPAVGRPAADATSEGAEGGTSVFAALGGWTSPGGKSAASGVYGGEPVEVADEEEVLDEGYYLIKTRLECDVYGCCLVTAMRGLRDGKFGPVIMSWVWVALSIFLSCTVALELLFGTQGVYDLGLPDTLRFEYEQIKERLEEALNGTKKLDVNVPLDKELFKVCTWQPSWLFILIMQMVWSSRMVGQFSQARTLLSILISCPVKEMRSFTILEDDGSTTIAGMMPFDGFVFSVILVVPKTISAILIFWAGCRYLALATDLLDLTFRAVSLHYVTIIETLVFRAFIAHSKKEWVERARVVQERTPIYRIFLSWPGEVAKFFSVLILLGIAIHVYRSSEQLRALCYQCVHSCPNACAEEFAKNCPTDATVSSLFPR